MNLLSYTGSVCPAASARSTSLYDFVVGDDEKLYSYPTKTERIRVVHEVAIRFKSDETVSGDPK